MSSILAAYGAGAALALQALINARLGRELGGPVWASIVSLLVGAVGLVAVQALSRATVPTTAQVAGVPAWAWFGGLLGAAYLTGTLFSVVRLGAASTIALIVFGQMTASLLLDQVGGLVAVPHALSLPRVAGAGLLLAGVILITRG
jgi:transporter family-2 protein